MQFLFGMALAEMIVQGTLFFARMHWWAAKLAWGLSLQLGRVAWDVARDAWWRWRRRGR